MGAYGLVGEESSKYSYQQICAFKVRLRKESLREHIPSRGLVGMEALQWGRQTGEGSWPKQRRLWGSGLAGSLGLYSEAKHHRKQVWRVSDCTCVHLRLFWQTAWLVWVHVCGCGRWLGCNCVHLGVQQSQDIMILLRREKEESACERRMKN